MLWSVRSRLAHAVVAVLVLPGLVGCAGMSNTAKGAAVGTVGGAVAGGVIGRAAGSTAKGVIIGAVVGGATGAIIGSVMDRQAGELERDIPGATVERVGEGILITFDSGLLFDFDSDRIRGETRSNLDELAQSLQKYPDTEIMIIGHTDATGGASYNQDLAERRAQAAEDYLGSRGVSRARVQTRGLGEQEPVASNEDEYGRSRNRRVEVAITAGDEMVEQARSQTGS